MRKMKICLISSILFLSACSLEARVENGETNYWGREFIGDFGVEANENTEIDNMRATREQQREIEAFVDEKREDYLSELGELTFTGDPDDLLGVRLSKGNMDSRENPAEYLVLEIDGNLMLEIGYSISIPHQSDSNTLTTSYEIEELEVLEIRFENETYIIEIVPLETDETDIDETDIDESETENIIANIPNMQIVELDEGEIDETERNENIFELEQVENSIIRLRDGRGDILVPEYHVPEELVSEWYEEAYTELGINPDELTKD